MGEEEQIPSSQWVRRVTGMTETEFRECKEDCIYEKESKYTTPEMIIVNQETEEEFSCGCLEILPLKEMRKYAKESNEPAFIELIVVEDRASQSKVNVATMQASYKYDNAVFLVASNFNGV